MKTCNKCNASMVLRASVKDALAKTQFWGCSSFPLCRYTESFTAEDLSDDEKHQIIHGQYDCFHNFSTPDVISLQSKLGFKCLTDFFQWLKAEEVRLSNGRSFHNFVNGVDSPYDGTFIHLIRGINANFNNPIEELQSYQNSYR